MNKTAVVQQAKTASFLSSAQGVLQRKCASGNRNVESGKCAGCEMKKAGLQRKLAIGASNDLLEQEAERVAGQVMAAPVHSVASGAPLDIQRYAGQATEGTDTAPTSVDRVLAGLGRPLEPALRQDMEQRFGHDFSRVRVHSGAAAEQSAREINACAYTVGQNVVFGTGMFAPGTQDGRRLIAHELTHVVQQTGNAPVSGERVSPAQPSSPQGDGKEPAAGMSSLRAPGSSTAVVQRFPGGEGEIGGGQSVAGSPYAEEPDVIAYAVGAQKLGKLVDGMVLFATKDWKVVAISQNAFYVGPFFSDMGSFYYVYRFTGSDQKTSTYTLTRGTYLPGPDDKNLREGLAQVQGKTTLQVKTSGLSPLSSGGSATKDPKAPTGTKDTGSKPGKDTSAHGGSDKPAQATDILPEFADKTVEQCRETVGDIYGGLNKEANSGILDHKLDAVNGMQTILDKTDPAVSSNVIFALSLVTNAAAGALGAGLPKIAANAIVWGAAGAANGAVAFFNNDNLIDAVEFCQKYTQSLRMNKDVAVKEVRSAIVGDLAQVRAAASSFRRMVQDTDQISNIKLNQEREVVDLWTNTILAEKEGKKGKKVAGPGDPGKVGSANYGSETEGRILLAAGRLEANPPPVENPFRWTKSPDVAVMPGVPDRARQKNLNRKIADVPVARTMRVVTSLATQTFTVAMSADGTETAQSFHGDPDMMHWVLASFLLDKALKPATDDGKRLIEANWKLGVTKCWDQVRNKTFAELGIKSIKGESGSPYRE